MKKTIKANRQLRPKSLSNKNCNTEETKDQIRDFYINSAGYGTVPKLVMQDRNLSVTSKAIYAYFCSYTGAGNTCFPSRQKICYYLNISKDRFARHLDPLITNGYIKLVQTKEKGSNKFARNLYTLLDRVAPYACAPCRKNQDTESKNIEKITHEPCPGFPDTGNKDTKNNNIKINNNKMNKYIRAKDCASVPIEPKNNKCANAQPLIENKNTEPLSTTKNKSLRKSKPKLAPKVLEEEFKAVWELYPKKKDKIRAFKAFSKARQRN